MKYEGRKGTSVLKRNMRARIETFHLVFRSATPATTSPGEPSDHLVWLCRTFIVANHYRNFYAPDDTGSTRDGHGLAGPTTSPGAMCCDGRLTQMVVQPFAFLESLIAWKEKTAAGCLSRAERMRA
jgi:hypothetical protein